MHQNSLHLKFHCLLFIISNLQTAKYQKVNSFQKLSLKHVFHLHTQPLLQKNDPKKNPHRNSFGYQQRTRTSCYRLHIFGPKQFMNQEPILPNFGSTHKHIFILFLLFILAIEQQVHFFTCYKLSSLTARIENEKDWLWVGPL